MDGGAVWAGAVYGWSDAEIEVSGVGSFINSLVGTTDGTILVKEGAMARSESWYGFRLGWWDSPLAKAIIRDPGTRLEVAAEIEVGGYSGNDEFAIGRGLIEVLAEASVTASQVYLGRSAGSTGDILVASRGSLSAEYQLVVGELGRGAMSVTSDGSATALWVFVGDRTGSEGTLSVETGGTVTSTLSVPEWR